MIDRQPHVAVPACIGIIPDGNRRWAKAKGLSTLEGHRLGYQKVKEVAEWAFDAGVKTLLVYAFSTENWERPPEEVSYLMKLLRWVLESEVAELNRKNVRVRVIGDLAVFPETFQSLARKAEGITNANSRGTLGVLLNYGGRREIVEAVRKIAAVGARAGEISEASFASQLWTADISHPDLVIRTSGVKRLSNFLTWGSAYSELFFSETMWPDFTKHEFDSILGEYANRERRFGK